MPEPGSCADGLGPPPRPQRATFRVVLADVCRSREHGVQQRRQVVERGRAEMRLVDWHLPPGRDLEPFLGARVDDGVLRTPAGGAIAAIEERGHDADALGVDRHPGSSSDRSEEVTWQREEHARPVTGQPVGRDRTPVTHAREAGQCELDDLTARAAALVGDEADPAGVELEPIAGSEPRAR